MKTVGLTFPAPEPAVSAVQVPTEQAPAATAEPEEASAENAKAKGKK